MQKPRSPTPSLYEQIDQRPFSDIVTAINRCRRYRKFLRSDDSHLSDMAFDAILHNLAVIGEAVRALPDALTKSRPDIPWTSIAGLRDIVVHEYFRVNPDLIVDIVDNYLGGLEQALEAH